MSERFWSLRIRFVLGDVLLVLLVIAPLGIAWDRLAPLIRDDWGDSLLVLGRVAGILGLALILLAGSMSVRVPHVDGLFGGLTHLWQVHHFVGFGGFLLVMAHVWLVGVSALPIARDLPARILFPPLDSLETWLGWIAFAALTLFLAPSFKFFGQPHYQHWKLLHTVAAPPALLLAFVHGLTLSPENGPWWALGLLAVLSIAWRRAGSRLLKRSYTVKAVKQLAPDVVELSLQPVDKAIRHAAGQFVYLTPLAAALSAGRGEEHPFSLSSAPGEDCLRIGIKSLGDASSALQTIPINSRVLVDGPYGQFFERFCPDRSQLWLGGGIGVTPIVGGARTIAMTGKAPAGGVHIFYLADSRDRAYYLDTLVACANAVEGLGLSEHYFSLEGPMSAGFLRKRCPDFAEREVYICGPRPMLDHFRRILRESGIPNSRIHSEEFSFL